MIRFPYGKGGHIDTGNKNIFNGISNQQDNPHYVQYFNVDISIYQNRR